MNKLNALRNCSSVDQAERTADSAGYGLYWLGTASPSAPAVPTAQVFRIRNGRWSGMSIATIRIKL